MIRKMRPHALALLLPLCGLPSDVAAAQSVEQSDTRKLVIESAGGTLGSLAGTAIGLAAFRVDKCPTDDDVVCVLERLSLTGVTSVVGATAGVVLIGRSRETDPSMPGALIGSIAGAAAGVGLLTLTERQRTGTGGRVVGVLLYGVTQGLISAAGSRIGDRLRR